MRIIDKNTDYYDYLQDREDSLVFDRRGSFLLTKDLFCKGVNSRWYSHPCDGCDLFRPVLLQCGATYWLIIVVAKSWDKSCDVTDYSLNVIATWKNYDKPRTIIRMNLFYFTDYRVWDYHYDTLNEIIADVDTLKSAIDHNNIQYLTTINKTTKTTDYKNTYIREEQVYPILTACGISNIIPAEDIYNALDEHFALNKSDAESTVAEGTTNNDKIVNHGFDTRVSFRGKTDKTDNT